MGKADSAPEFSSRPPEPEAGILPTLIVRASLAVILGGGIVYLVLARKPWHTGVGEALAGRRAPALADCLAWGHWFAALAATVLVAALAATVTRWRRGNPATVVLPGLGEPPLPGKWLALGLAILLPITLVTRLPRMTQSFWGDEAMAVESYVQGRMAPKNPADLQGPLRFRPVPWARTLSGDQGGGNNHYLFTILSRVSLETWRKIGRHPREAFSEAACRAPSLIAGLGCLVALALFGRRLGAPRAGLLGAILWAIHPWHLRYSTEARGYTLMTLFLLVALIFLCDALERGRWRDWLLFALAEFLAMYSCKLVAYPLVVLNVAVLGLVLGAALTPGRSLAPGARFTAVLRWLISNSLAAVTFLFLYLPCHPQIVAARAMIEHRGSPKVTIGRLLDLTAEIATGVPALIGDAANPFEVSWQRLVATQPWLILGLLPMLLLAVWGGIVVLRTSRPVGWLFLSILLGAMVSAAHVIAFLHWEVLPWYGFYLTPGLCLVAAIGGIDGSSRPGFREHRRFALRWVAVPLLFGLAVWPMNRQSCARAYEDLRRAALATRGRHPNLDMPERSRLFTSWLWRYNALYDPRLDNKVRTAAALDGKLEEVRQARGEFYYIVGFRSIFRELDADLLARLESPDEFDKREVFWAQEAKHTLTVYRWRKRVRAGVSQAVADQRQIAKP